MNLSQRLQIKIKVDLLDGCWLWTAGLFQSGYAQISIKNKTYRAHRISYEFWKGKIPEGLVIDHLCRNKSCINPNHLEAVTPSVNVKRGITIRIPKTHCKQGHLYNKENTYIEPNGHRHCRICGRKWNQELYKSKNKNSIYKIL